MSLYYKVKVTKEQFDVVLREMRNRGIVMDSWSGGQMKKDFEKYGYTYASIGYAGDTIGWSGDPDLDVMEFEELMTRLDAGIPPLRAFRKVHTYTNNQ